MSAEANWPIEVGGVYQLKSYFGEMGIRIIAKSDDGKLSTEHVWLDGRRGPYAHMELNARTVRNLCIPEDQSALPRLYALLEALVATEDEGCGDILQVTAEARALLAERSR